MTILSRISSHHHSHVHIHSSFSKVKQTYLAFRTFAPARGHCVIYSPGLHAPLLSIVGQGRFDIGLYYGANCDGTPVADLCGKTNSKGELIGCQDTAGDYDVVVPLDIMSGECESAHQALSCSCMLKLPRGVRRRGLCLSCLLASRICAEHQRNLGRIGRARDCGSGTSPPAALRRKNTHTTRCPNHEKHSDHESARVPLPASAPVSPVISSSCSLVFQSSLPLHPLFGFPQDSIKVGLFGALSPTGCSPPFYIQALASLGVANSSEVGTGIVVPTPWEGYLFPKPDCDADIPVEVRLKRSLPFHGQSHGTGCPVCAHTQEMKVQACRVFLTQMHRYLLRNGEKKRGCAAEG